MGDTIIAMDKQKISSAVDFLKILGYISGHRLIELQVKRGSTIKDVVIEVKDDS